MSDPERLEELRRFLKDRRARLHPQDVGLPATSRRRVRGLRREEVATLAGIGVSWYTAFENGDARGISDATLAAVADALRLTASEREYLAGLTGRAKTAVAVSEEPRPAAIDAMMAIAFPAYIITAAWKVIACNEAFRLVWGVGDHEVPFDAVGRLFMHAATRQMHGEHFATNIAPVVAMIRSGIGRHPELEELRDLRDRLVADPAIRSIWDAFEITDPKASTQLHITSPIGIFNYETLSLPLEGALVGIVVQVPDVQSRARLERARAALR
jgi:transcriptional regulator with XRE-family HTH domain